MATLSIPYTFTNGEVIDADEMNDNFDEIANFLNVEKLDPANLKKSEALITFPFYISDVSGSTVSKPKIRVPAGHDYYFVDVSFMVDSISGSGTFSADLIEESGSTSLLTGGAIDRTTAGSSFVTSFESDFASGGDVMRFEVSKTSGSGSASDVTVILTVKATLTD